MPPSAFFCEISSSSRCRGPLFHNCPTKPEQTRASVQGSHASPRLPELLRLAGAPLGPRAPCHPGAAISASPSSFRSCEVPRPRDPGAAVCVPLAAGRSCAGRAAGALLSLGVSGGAVTASPSPPRGWHTGGAARCSPSQGPSSRVLWGAGGADLLLPPSVLGPLCSLRDRLLSLIFTLSGPFTQHVARLHRREGIRPGPGGKQAGVGAVLQAVVRKALSFSPESRRHREGSAQLFGDHNPGRGTSRRRARRWRCPPAAASQEPEEQSPAADTVGREACGETGPGGLGSGEAAGAEGWASAWSQTGAREGAEQARLDLPLALSGPGRLLGCSWSRNSDQV